ncbi:MAG: UDP-N-acetylglucosamine 2-epimerase (non-hydrolyzing) [Candidatus Babeliales bacterium]
MIKPIVLIIGTRPEGIKMIPVYFALKDAGMPVIICSTWQHNELLSEVYSLFNIKPEINFDIMRPGQDLFYLTQEILIKIKKVFQEINPSLVLVQGDTTSAMTAALAAFYLHIPVGHIEAGLRTAFINNPFPEEFNRRVISMVAQYHFAPTQDAEKNLHAEKINPATIFCTGNTVVDALFIMKKKIEKQEIIIDKSITDIIETTKKNKKKLILLTVHRRESFSEGIRDILKAVKSFARRNDEVIFFYPYHPNPNVTKIIQEIDLVSEPNIFLSPPVSYKELVYLLLNSDIVATDSGGICEEAVSLKKPVLILRNETERVEAIKAGLAYLVGTQQKNVEDYLGRFMQKTNSLNKKNTTIFGDGFAAKKIAAILKDAFKCSQFLNKDIKQSTI